MPVHWLDSTQDGGPINRPWEVAERERREREEREERERVECMARAGIPPPRGDEMTRRGHINAMARWRRTRKATIASARIAVYGMSISM